MIQVGGSGGGYPGVVSDTNNGLIIGDAGLGQFSRFRRDGSIHARTITGAELVSESDLRVLTSGLFGSGIGLFGHSAPGAAIVGGVRAAGAGYTANEQAMLEAVYTALQAIGLVT